jgi:hypothetical protein
MVGGEILCLAEERHCLCTGEVRFHVHESNVHG